VAPALQFTEMKTGEQSFRDDRVTELKIQPRQFSQINRNLPKENNMLKKYSALLLSVLFLLSVVTQQTTAATKQDKQRLAPDPIETVKSKIAKIGLGAKAKATVTLKNGTRVKGYIAHSSEEDFVIRDRKTDSPTTVNYNDVATVEYNRGHSTANHVLLGVGIGVGAFVAAVLIIIAHFD
jgi:hypothetical protein